MSLGLAALGVVNARDLTVYGLDTRTGPITPIRME